MTGAGIGFKAIGRSGASDLTRANTCPLPTNDLLYSCLPVTKRISAGAALCQGKTIRE